MADILEARRIAESMNYSLDKEIDSVLFEEQNRLTRQSKLLEARLKANQSAIDILVAQLKQELNDTLGDNLLKALNLQFSKPQSISVLALTASFEYQEKLISLTLKGDFDWEVSGFEQNVVCKYDGLKQVLINFLAAIKSANASEQNVAVES